MKNRLIYIIIIVLFAISGCSFNTSNKDNLTNGSEDSSVEVINLVKAIINEREYIVNLEENDTVQAFIEFLPNELNFNELNGNEKYTYLDSTLPTSASNPEHINKGDIMLYGNNCLVVFYKSFETPYSYTKIGHIDNLPDLGNSNITIKFKK